MQVDWTNACNGVCHAWAYSMIVRWIAHWSCGSRRGMNWIGLRRKMAARMEMGFGQAASSPRSSPPEERKPAMDHFTPGMCPQSQDKTEMGMDTSQAASSPQPPSDYSATSQPSPTEPVRPRMEAREPAMDLRQKSSSPRSSPPEERKKNGR